MMYVDFQTDFHFQDKISYNTSADRPRVDYHHIGGLQYVLHRQYIGHLSCIYQ